MKKMRRNEAKGELKGEAAAQWHEYREDQADADEIQPEVPDEEPEVSVPDVEVDANSTKFVPCSENRREPRPLQDGNKR